MPKALIVNPRAKTVEEIDLPETDFGEVIRLKIGGWLQTAPLVTNGDISWCDEEGLINGTDVYTKFAAYPQPIAGIVVITGRIDMQFPDVDEDGAAICVREDGEDDEDQEYLVDVKTTAEELRASVEFMDAAAFHRWATAHGQETMRSVISFGPSGPVEVYRETYGDVFPPKKEPI